MSKVRGSNVIVAEYVELVGAYIIYGCAQSCSLTLGTEFIETTVKGSGKFASFKPAKMSFSGSVQGLVNIGGTEMLNLADLRARQIAQQLLLISYTRTAENGAVYQESGNFYIKSTEDSAVHDGVATYSIELIGSGPLSQVVSPIIIFGQVKRFEYTGVGGETVINNVKDVASNTTVSLVGKTVLGFEKDGVGYSKMITTGVPAAKEFLFNGATGAITIAIPYEAGEETFGYYR